MTKNISELDWFEQQEIINRNLYVENLSKLLDDSLFLAICIGEHTYMAEILEVLGEEALIKLIKHFSGTKIRVPGVKDLARAKRNWEIYIGFKDFIGGPLEKGELIRRFGRAYGLSTYVVKKTIADMREFHMKLLDRKNAAKKERIAALKKV